MYGFIDESRLANGEVGGLIEDPMVVEKSQGSGIGKSLQLSQIHRLYPEDIDIDIKRDINNKDIKECNIELSELDEFLHCRGCNDNNREMVGQDMAQSYNELFHAAQEPQEFISLEELGPRITSTDHHCHPVANTVINNDQLYGDADEGQHQSQPRTYYNLSSLPDSCASVYFGDIRTGNNDIQAGEPLAPTATPATGTPLSPERLNRHQSNIKNNSPADREKIIGSINTTTTTIHALTVSVATSVSTSSTNCTRRDAKVSRADETLAEYDKSCIEPFTHPDIRTMQISQPGLSPTQSNSYHHHHHHHHHHRHHHHREIIDTQCTTPEDDCAPLTKKRKISCQEDNDLIEDATEDTKSVRTNADSKKQNHSEIEKRRRDKMNTYITELSAMIPMCHAMSRKLDKLTVLRMAVQHIKTILGAVTTYTEGHYKPAFLSDQELKTLILQAADGFLFVVGCDRGKILYVSESVSEILNYSQDDLLGQSWFDILHPKDVAKVKEQLSSSDLSPRERLIDARTMLPVKTDVPQDVSRLCPGARRSFFCRMKRKIIENSSGCNESQIKEETDAATGCHRRKKQQSTDWKYCVIQCTGYLKSWAPAKLCLEEPEGESDGEACNLSCLVAVGRVQPSLPALTSNSSRSPRLRTIEFVSRHATDGKFLFVDQRATIVLGFLPQELLGTSMYEYYHHDDIPHLAESHKAALKSSERVTTQVYRFKAKGASIVRLQSEWRSFENPWTKDIEYLIAKNSAVFQENSRNESENSNVQENYDFFTQSNASLGRLISSQVEISTAASSERDRESTQSSIGNEANDLTPAFNTVLSSVSLNMSNDQGTSSDNNMLEMMGDTAISESPNPLTTDGSDEAAMAVIMSLLEADAGLGGPVDFSGLPWPLP
ncbi:basic helix-loop-helix ARNT-like protein 1 isoform X1 [Microplitis demolitor]|uniref:basic helix-loop-helix ARNT-like protein 1 isoform X1 n=1 Tax=Microplitis demolitor TaxID=69319 RepID=UPI0004CCDB90|nr:basic helix-loop-helix ARNT-like protein 1 isoform X1 [Microplitis demolitor]